MRLKYHYNKFKNKTGELTLLSIFESIQKKVPFQLVIQKRNKTLGKIQNVTETAFLTIAYVLHHILNY